MSVCSDGCKLCLPDLGEENEMNNKIRVVCALAAALAAGGGAAQTPSILLEACNAMEPASKRIECLRAANGTRSNASAAYGGSTPPRAASVASQPTSLAPAARRSTEGQTCYTGPRGGTYTITASGRKNYSGC